MEHVGSCHVGDSLNSAFGHPILMMSTHSTETQGLVQSIAVGPKSRRTEYTIVRVITLDFHANICSFPFQEQFATYSITGRSGQLVIDKEEGATVVHIDGTAGVTIRGGAVTRR
jgi:hypothetical protein